MCVTRHFPSAVIEFSKLSLLTLEMQKAEVFFTKHDIKKGDSGGSTAAGGSSGDIFV